MNMSMSPYNRSNPFMYITETSQEMLVRKTEILIQKVILQGILGLVTGIIILIHYFITGNPSPFVYLGVILFGIFFSYLQMKRAIHDSKREDMNEMILGDHYKDINVNNEKLLTETMQFYQSIGRVEFAIESCYFMWFICFISLSHCMLNMLVDFFS